MLAHATPEHRDRLLYQPIFASRQPAMLTVNIMGDANFRGSLRGEQRQYIFNLRPTMQRVARQENFDHVNSKRSLDLILHDMADIRARTADAVSKRTCANLCFFH